jgi:hypothetical protein
LASEGPRFVPAELRQQYAKAGFEVVGILTDNASPSEITNLMQKYGVPYPILICNHKTAQAYGGLPVCRNRSISTATAQWLRREQGRHPRAWK